MLTFLILFCVQRSNRPHASASHCNSCALFLTKLSRHFSVFLQIISQELLKLQYNWAELGVCFANQLYRMTVEVMTSENSIDKYAFATGNVVMVKS